MPHAEPALVLFRGALGDAVCLEPAVVAHLAESMAVTLYARGGAAEVAALYPSPVACARSMPSRSRGSSRRPTTRARGSGFEGFAHRQLHGAGVPVVERARRDRPRQRRTFRAHRSASTRRTFSLRAVGADPGADAVRAAPDRAGRPRAATLRGCSRCCPAAVATKTDSARDPEAVAARWSAASGEVVVVLGPADRARQAMARDRAVARPDSVGRLAAVLAGATAFVGNDAGPSHVAAALRTPGVVVYATTGPGTSVRAAGGVGDHARPGPRQRSSPVARAAPAVTLTSRGVPLKHDIPAAGPGRARNERTGRALPRQGIATLEQNNVRRAQALAQPDSIVVNTGRAERPHGRERAADRHQPPPRGINEMRDPETGRAEALHAAESRDEGNAGIPGHRSRRFAPDGNEREEDAASEPPLPVPPHPHRLRRRRPDRPQALLSPGDTGPGARHAHGGDLRGAPRRSTFEAELRHVADQPQHPGSDAPRRDPDLEGGQPRPRPRGRASSSTSSRVLERKTQGNLDADRAALLTDASSTTSARGSSRSRG